MKSYEINTPRSLEVLHPTCACQRHIELLQVQEQAASLPGDPSNQVDARKDHRKAQQSHRQPGDSGNGSDQEEANHHKKQPRSG